MKTEDVRNNKNNDTTAEKEQKDPRIILYVEKNGEDAYVYHVINTLGQSVCAAYTVNAKLLPFFKTIFPTAVCNFVMKGEEPVFGWPADEMDVFDELVRNLHAAACKPDLSKEDKDWSEYYSSEEDDEDEEPWDADIPEEERITNPSSAEIEKRLKELKMKKQQ